MKKYFSLFFCFFTVIVFGQGFTITGTVTNESGELLPVANIVVKGTDNGTHTNDEGRYTLSNVTDSSVLKISYIGYITKEITVGNEHIINIMLNRDAKVLEEIEITAHTIHNSNVSNQIRLIVPNKSNNEEFYRQVSHHMQYLFPRFMDGVVYYKESIAKGMLNYNILLGEMHFVENDEILALDNVKNILFIKIGDRVFFPLKDSEFSEEIFLTDITSLRVIYKGNLSSYTKESGYGTQSATYSITTINNAIIGAPNASGSSRSVLNRKISEQSEDMMITVDYFYYLVGTNGKHLMIKNLNTFTNQYKKNKKQIETFANENKIHLNNREDLILLLKYCDKLQQ